MSLVEVLPLAIVMISGPQIISAVFLATSKSWRKNSLGFIIGSSISISLVVSASYLLGLGFTESLNSSRPLLYVAVALLLIYGMIETYRTRKVSKPPEWMGKLQSATSRSSFRLGFLLLGFFPTNIATSLAVGAYLSSRSEPIINASGFIFLTILLLSAPSLLLLIFGEKAEKKLPEVRNWMNENSWLINEIVFLIFLALTISNLI